MTVANIFLALALGAIVSIYFPMIAQSAKILGSGPLANVPFFGIAFAASIVIAMATGNRLADLRKVSEVPPWLLTAGIMSAGLIIGSSYIIPRIGISFEVPAGWTQPDDTLTWSPSRSAPFSLHFAWTPITEASGQPADLLPAGTDLAAGEPLTLAWAPAASRYPLDQPDQAAIYVLIPAGDRAYAFHILAPSPATLPQIEPVLAHALDSVQIDFVIETYLPEPTDAAVGFFQAVIADPAGKSALPFLSPTLRSTIPAGEPPITLLNLSDRLVEFNLDWAFSASRSVTVSALLQTADGRTTERILTLVLLDDLGWRIDAIAEADE